MVERHGSTMNHNPNLTSLEKAIPEEKEPDHRMEQKHGSKQFRVEEIPFVKKRLEALNGRRPFNPFAHFTITSLLSLVNPQFYTEEEFAIIKEINQSRYQQSLSTSRNNTMEEEEETVNNKKKPRCIFEEGSPSKINEPNKKSKKEKPTPSASCNNTIEEEEEEEAMNNMKRPRCIFEEGNMFKMNESNKKSKKGEPTLMQPLPDLPVHLTNMIANLKGTDVRFVMCKKLFDTDLKLNNNRLSMPLKEIKCDFLTEIEKAILDSKKNGKPVGLEVTVLDPSFTEYTMQLKKWEMRKSYLYNLVTNWKQLLLKNKLRKNSKLNIWSFRVNERLYFTLNNKRERS